MNKEWNEKLESGGESYYKVQHIPSGNLLRISTHCSLCDGIYKSFLFTTCLRAIFRLSIPCSLAVMLSLKYILYVEPYFLQCLPFLYDNALIVIIEHDDFIIWFNEDQEMKESTALTPNI
ncbi:hypothetical protein YC2023_073789 [Brassica napus]